MFRHQGKSRTLKHNIQIATVLSFVAGIVNITGFLFVHTLTTNLTGHFAFVIDDVLKLELGKAMTYFFFITSFLLGSFVSSALIELISRNKKFNIFVFPTLLEVFVLLFVPIAVYFTLITSGQIIACLLLFAMGVQNSFVTKISNAVVRTTHLTGLFTDLGIDLSHLMFKKPDIPKSVLRSRIKLRLYIINFFFLGGIIGGLIYNSIEIFALLPAAAILLFGLVYDNLRFKVIMINRKYFS